MQGVVKAYDPVTGMASSCATPTSLDYDLGADALEGSVFRMLRQGQRVIFDLDDDGPRHRAAPGLARSTWDTASVQLSGLRSVSRRPCRTLHTGGDDIEESTR